MRAAMQQFFRDVQQRFQGDYVVDIAALRQTAQTVLPLLESREETQPYAAWLKARMDYLDVADEIRLTIPPPAVETNPPPRPVPNPFAANRNASYDGEKNFRRPLAGHGKRICAGVEADFHRATDSAGTGLGGGVESSFDRRALSPAGAAGLFQLMPDTARRFGLSLWPRDQRFQPEPSATAAARYLKYLYDRFKDWRLALAAYNAGEGTVQKLLNRYKTDSYDAIAEHLPAETQMYVPRIEAILRQREGATSNNFPRHQEARKPARCPGRSVEIDVLNFWRGKWADMGTTPHGNRHVFGLSSPHDRQKISLSIPGRIARPHSSGG
jgi:membrane-bound lytic murein transglycosylase D